MRDLLRYGVDLPIITCSLLILGLVLVILHPTYWWFLGVLFVLIGSALSLYTWWKYQMADEMLKHCDLRTAQKMLDLGTGRGYFMTHDAKAAGYVAFVTGIEDPHYDRIYQARRNAKKEKVNNRINVIHGDIRHLPFPPASFDVITSLGDWLSSAFRAHQWQAVCDDVLRVMKSNGKFMMIGHQTRISQVAKYLKKQDYMKVNVTPSGSRWDNLKWGALIATKTM